MKTMTVNYAENLRRFIAFFSSLNASANAETSNTRRIQASLNDSSEDNEKQSGHVQNGRKAFTGNFFAGPHCIFDPRFFA